MQAKALAKLLSIQWAGLAEHSEQFQLDGAQQRLRAPERKSQLRDRVGGQRLDLPGSRHRVRFAHSTPRFEVRTLAFLPIPCGRSATASIPYFWGLGSSG